MFQPDYGLKLLDIGTSRDCDLYFLEFALYSLSILGRGEYSTMVTMPFDGQNYALSLDFSQNHLEQILCKAPQKIADYLREEISRDFRSLLQDDTFYAAMSNTFVYTFITVPLGVFTALVTAALLNAEIRAKGLFRTIFFTPVVVPGVALGVIWLFLLQAKYGIVNRILGTEIPFLTSSSYALTTVSLIGVWASVGYYCVLFIAGMQSISPTFYEAARIDGSGGVRNFFSITLPLLSPTIFMVLILSVINGLQIFDLPTVMVQNENPAYASVRPVLEFYFRYTFNAGKPGIGAVVVLILLAIILVITAVQFRLQRKWVHYE